MVSTQWSTIHLFLVVYYANLNIPVQVHVYKCTSHAKLDILQRFCLFLYVYLLSWHWNGLP